MFCANCGAPLSQGDRFCGSCDTPRAASRPVRRNKTLTTALVSGGFLLGFALIPFLANHPREFPRVHGASPEALLAPPPPQDPLQSHPGSETEDDYFLKVDWELHNGRFPFSHVDRQASVTELEKLTEEHDRLVQNGTLSPSDEAPDDRFIYGGLFRANRTRMDRMAEQFKALARQRDLSSYELVLEVVRCIQRIPYAIPDEVVPDHKLGIFTPNEVAYYAEGDCDTKSLMAAVLLTRLGYRCVLFGSNYYSHCMLGVETDGEGRDHTDYDGHRYQWVEMTCYEAPLGKRFEDCYDESKWVVTPLE